MGDYHSPDAMKARAIRAKICGTQDSFAKMVGVPVGTVRNWEHGRRKPTGPARVLLRLLESDPEIVTVLLRRVYRIERAQTAQAQCGVDPPAAQVSFCASGAITAVIRL